MQDSTDLALVKHNLRQLLLRLAEIAPSAITTFTTKSNETAYFCWGVNAYSSFEVHLHRCVLSGKEVYSAIVIIAYSTGNREAFDFYESFSKFIKTVRVNDCPHIASSTRTDKDSPLHQELREFHFILN